MNGMLAAQHAMPVSLPPGLDVSLVGGGSEPPSHLTSTPSSQYSGSPCMVNGLGAMMSAPSSLNGTPTNGMAVSATRQRKYNFSFRDKDLLVTLIERHGDVVESRTGDGVTTEQKNAAWADIQARFNAQNDISLHRSVTELKKCYWNLKQKTKKALDAGREAGGTARVDRVLWRIAQLAPEQFEALLGMQCEVVDTGADGDVKVNIKPEQSWDPMSDMEASNMSRAESPPTDNGDDNSPPADLDMYPIPTDFCAVELGSATSQTPPSSVPPPPLPQQQLQHLQEQYRKQTQAAAQQQQHNMMQQQHEGKMQQLLQQQQRQQQAAAASFAERWCAALQWTSQASRPPAALPDLHRLVNGHAGGVGGVGGVATSVAAALRPPEAAEPPPVAAAERRGVKRPAAAPAADGELELRRVEHEYKMRLLKREAEFLEARHRLEMQVLQQQSQFWGEALHRSRQARRVKELVGGEKETEDQRRESMGMEKEEAECGDVVAQEGVSEDGTEGAIGAESPPAGF